MDEYKDIGFKCPDDMDAAAVRREIDYHKTIGNNLAQKLSKLNKITDFGKLKVYADELIYENYNLEKKLHRLSKSNVWVYTSNSYCLYYWIYIWKIFFVGMYFRKKNFNVK